ncbi:MAG: hypothetical protein R2728_06945 [Chitinophagales bacterium]
MPITINAQKAIDTVALQIAFNQWANQWLPTADVPDTYIPMQLAILFDLEKECLLTVECDLQMKTTIIPKGAPLPHLAMEYTFLMPLDQIVYLNQQQTGMETVLHASGWYGSHTRQRYYVYYPANKNPHSPVVLLVHGGAWSLGPNPLKLEMVLLFN